MNAVFDSNALLALSIQTHPHHRIVQNWFDNASMRPGELLMTQATEISLSRLLTQASVMKQCSLAPMTNRQANEHVAAMYLNPIVGFLIPSPRVRSRWRRLATLDQPAPNRWMDAFLAAIAIESGAQMVTFDQGFRQFEPLGLSLTLLQVQ